MIRVLLEVTSPALREGLRALLAADEAIRIVNHSLSEEDQADVVITSASQATLLDGDFAAPESAAVLLLSDEPLKGDQMKQASQVWGILPTEASAEELSAAIHALSQGLVVGPASLLFESEAEPSSHGPLTEREAEVLALLSRGMANKQIAVALGISEHTVKFHVSSIYTKLNVTNRTEAVREGLRGGWVAL